MTDQYSFIMRVLAAFDECGDNIDREALWWRTDTDYAPVTFFINCNDFFYWGTSDCEKLTPDNITMLLEAQKDCVTALGDDHGVAGRYSPLLFCARLRQLRPQGAAYTILPKKLWPLFDACGPVRRIDLVNPKPRPDLEPAS